MIALELISQRLGSGSVCSGAKLKELKRKDIESIDSDFQGIQNINKDSMSPADCIHSE